MKTVEIVLFLKILFFTMFNFFVSIKILDNKEYWNLKYKLIFFVCSLIIATICKWIESLSNMNVIVFIMIFTAMFYSIITKNGLGYSILVNVISTSINLIILFIATILTFIPHIVFRTENKYINLIIIILIYLVVMLLITKIRRIKNGIAILKKNKENQYFDIIILNISWIIIFLTIVIDNYKVNSTGRAGVGFILFAIVMIVTIQKSLQLYYKQFLIKVLFLFSYLSFLFFYHPLAKQAPLLLLEKEI